MLTLSKRLWQMAVVAALLAAAAGAQQNTGPSQPTFETASIRPSHMTNGCFSMLPPGGTHYELTCVTLRNLIEMAYKTTYIEGGDRALDLYYDLRATTPDASWTVDTVRKMLQPLLAERFHLVVHAGTRQVSGYGMVVAKGGPKLHSAGPEAVVQGQKAGESSRNFTYPGRVQGRGLTSAGIASLLAIVVHAPVVDQTDITGLFDVDLSYAPDGTTDSNLPSFFTAIEEQIGLKLRSEKVAVDTLVVDHADETPTPN